MSIRRTRPALALVSVLLLSSCKEDEQPTTLANDYVFTQPANFPGYEYTFENNPVTREGFELGRMLFYDPILSSDSTVACANCHQQVRAFSDPVHRFSKGVNDVSGVRNAPAVQNVAFQKSFFWDGGVNHVDFIPINAITNPLEMHETLAEVVSKLQGSESYSARFSKAFADDEITSQHMLFALSQFLCMMISSNSRYDKYIRNEGEILTREELDGMAIFEAKCSTCHTGDLFTDGNFRNNGLDATFDKDIGRAKITETDSDRGKFKVPSLRNAEFTHPYMHDGRFSTLEDVIDHYRNSVLDSPTLDDALRQNGKLGIEITDEEKSKLIMFIKTLSDQQFLEDKRFSRPLIK